MSKNTDKTNVMRILDQKKIPYRFHAYDNTKRNAADVARTLGQNPGSLFKTLVTVSRSRENYVFMVPSEKELDLKKAAKAAGEKSLEMIPQKELLPLTGYVHGGCSPIGMKKPFKTFIDRTAETFDTICFSGGKVGYQVEISLPDLQKAMNVTPADLAKDMQE